MTSDRLQATNKLRVLTVGILSFVILHLSLVAVSLADGPHAFPVPFTPSRNASHTVISFTNLPSSGSIKIYTIDGRLVSDLSIPAGAGIVDWPATNNKGEKVATGVYLFVVDGDGSKTDGKLVIIR